MIDPSNITNFERTKEELEEFLLFGICVAGKNSDTQAKKLDSFLKNIPHEGSPFEKIRFLIRNGESLLEDHLRNVKIGKYYLLVPSFEKLALSNIDLKSISRERLEMFPGIGPKTSRFFILHSREDVNVACLDTHILKWMRDIGYQAPKSTPSGNEYLRLEKNFLQEATERNIHPAVLDLEIWNYYSGNKKEMVM